MGYHLWFHRGSYGWMEKCLLWGFSRERKFGLQCSWEFSRRNFHFNRSNHSTTVQIIQRGSSFSVVKTHSVVSTNHSA